MKFIKYFRYSILSLFMLMGCTDEFEEMNRDPWKSNDLDPKHLFTFSQLKMFSSGHEGFRGNLIMSGPLSQNLACNYTQGSGFRRNDGFTEATWSLIFGDVVKNITDIQSRLGEQEGQEGKIAQAQIVKVVNLLRMTALYGDIPYTEAGQGFTERNFYPKFDDQETVLNTMVTELEEARSVLLNSSTNTNLFTNTDAAELYEPSTVGAEKYVRLANSLLMKIGMMMSHADPTKGQEVFLKGMNGDGGYITDWSNAVYVNHADVGGPWGQHVNGTGVAVRGEVGGFSGPFMSELALKNMQQREDPRLFRIASHLTLDGSAYVSMEDTARYTNFDPFAQAGGPNEFKEVHFRGMRYGENAFGTKGLFHNSSTDQVVQAALWADQTDYEFEGKGQFATLASLAPATYNRVTPSIVIGADEMNFMLAEAVIRYGVAGDAKTFFTTAVTQALSKYDAINFPGKEFEMKMEELYKRQTNDAYSHDAAVAAYIANANQAYDDATDKLEVIAYESWISNIGDGYNAFANWNRTNKPSIVRATLSQEDDGTYNLPSYPGDPLLETLTPSATPENVPLHLGGVTNYVRPARFPYPDRELTVHPSETNRVIEEQRANSPSNPDFIGIKQWYSFR
ncbi:SusD/RagB family nutrient-binding outer membrane lipoprotein [Flammeovirga sp. SJP92]|uniref:SusD/RagB family nutrient-binding outer membrane lipoprotein n=1 Tax=Flammeovirga sp. SJP92 TaxID=1775430 RepID=UPI000B02EBF6|nr:SusD/RagB family nutrient-binding outer membrane lipoprotein [Flammeovirga sp. SJP92]